MKVQCPDCGPYKLDLTELRKWSLDTDWLIRKLRSALGIPAHSAVHKLHEGVWQIGVYKKRAVLLAQRIELVLINALSLFHGATPRPDSWVITPKPLLESDPKLLGNTATWWHLEEQFAIHGNGLRLVADEAEVQVVVESQTSPVHGPFSETFEWVYLPDWSSSPIRLSAAQAAIFAALWYYRGEPQSSETIMRKAHLNSDKLVDVFKVKAANKGDPMYEGPMHVYETLVIRNKRVGLYVLR